MSVTDIPVELLTPEQRAERIAELERAVSREWLLFAVVETAVIFVPFVVLVAAYATDGISFDALALGCIVAGTAMGALIAFWVIRRILPLNRRLQTLRAVVG